MPCLSDDFEYQTLAEAHTFLQQGIGLDFVNGKKLVACDWQEDEDAGEHIARFLFETVDGSCFALPLNLCPEDEEDCACAIIQTINQSFLLGRYVMQVPNAYDITESSNTVYGFRGFLKRVQRKIEHDRKLTWCQGTRSTQSAISTFAEHPMSAFRDLSDTIFQMAKEETC